MLKNKNTTQNSNNCFCKKQLFVNLAQKKNNGNECKNNILTVGFLFSPRKIKPKNPTLKIVFLILTSSVIQLEFDLFSSHRDRGDVFFKH